MRIGADLWVMSYLRRLSSAAIMAHIARRGEAERGTVWIKVALRDRKAALYGPAPAGLDETGSERRFVLAMAPTEERDVDARLARERSFDSDIWIVEVEDPAGRHLLGEELVAG